MKNHSKMWVIIIYFTPIIQFLSVVYAQNPKVGEWNL